MKGIIKGQVHTHKAPDGTEYLHSHDNEHKHVHLSIPPEGLRDIRLVI